MNDVIKENTELKNQLVDNKNIEEKIKNLIDENKKKSEHKCNYYERQSTIGKEIKRFSGL